MPNVGVVAQVLADFMPDTKSVTLDIASIITRWDPSRKPAIIGEAWPPENHVVAWNPRPPMPAANPANAGPAPPPHPSLPMVRSRNARAARPRALSISR